MSPRHAGQGRRHQVAGPLRRGSRLVLHPRPFRDKLVERRDGGLQIGFHADRARARHGASVQRRGAARRAARERRPHGLYRLRLHRQFAACRLAAADHDAALVAEDRPPADHPDGRRHHQGRRSVVPRRGASVAHRRADQRQHGRHQEGLFEVPEVRQRPDRRGDAQQRRLARHAALHPDAARCRTALLGQPHAQHELGEAPARARPAVQLPRIQLHDPAVLRLRRTVQAPGLHPADGRLGPVGQHRHGRRSRPAHGECRTVRRHDAADRHLVGREDGQVDGRRRLAERRARIGL